mmetsp:Transcript_55454/g.121323  ORF Transcript_55454/g.121323 Transcript_55454/m.121323 type:complete len:719 (-) Transcript_55454:209-2365(-)
MGSEDVAVEAEDCQSTASARQDLSGPTPINSQSPIAEASSRQVRTLSHLSGTSSASGSTTSLVSNLPPAETWAEYASGNQSPPCLDGEPSPFEEVLNDNISDDLSHYCPDGTVDDEYGPNRPTFRVLVHMAENRIVPLDDANLLQKFCCGGDILPTVAFRSSQSGFSRGSSSYKDCASLEAQHSDRCHDLDLITGPDALRVSSWLSESISASASRTAKALRSTDSSGTSMPSISTRRSTRTMTILDKESLADPEDPLGQLVTFQGCEELRRGTALSVLLSHGGQILASSKGTDETFRMSEPKDHIDDFVSHNWSVHRFYKFLVLVYHYQRDTSALVPALFLLGLGVATVLFDLPCTADETVGVEVGYLGRIFAIPLAILALLRQGDVARLFGWRGRTVFLDKTCICQTDAELQQSSIVKLGAFIGTSKRMLAIYSDVYLRRLWTAYEVAAFLCLRPVKDLRILPLEAPLLYLAMLSVSWVAQVSGIFTKQFLTMEEEAHAVTFWMASLAIFLIFRVVARSKATTLRNIAEFKITDCACAEEADRVLVYKNIAHLMQRTMGLDRSMPQDQVLAAFDDVVRYEFPRALRKQIGNFVFPYKSLMLIALLHDVPYLVDKLYAINNLPNHDVLATALLGAIDALAISPVTFLALQWVASRFLDVGRVPSAAWCLFGVTSVLSIWHLASHILPVLVETDIGLFSVSIFFVLLIVGLAFSHSCLF